MIGLLQAKESKAFIQPPVWCFWSCAPRLWNATRRGKVLLPADGSEYFRRAGSGMRVCLFAWVLLFARFLFFLRIEPVRVFFFYSLALFLGRTNKDGHGAEGAGRARVAFPIGQWPVCKPCLAMQRVRDEHNSERWKKRRGIAIKGADLNRQKWIDVYVIWFNLNWIKWKAVQLWWTAVVSEINIVKANEWSPQWDNGGALAFWNQIEMSC